MSRRRDLESSEWFHIVHKGADGQDIFSAPSHRTVYEGFMADAFERSAIELHAYAWMTNHLHKLVRVPNGGLPEAMRLLGMRYATVYNGWTDRRGPLFTARYFSEPVTSDAQLAQTARYIHRNPLPIVGTAGLVEYRWSSLGALCGRRPVPPWLSTGLVTDGFDVGGYERYILAPQPSDRFGLGALPPLTPTECDDIERAVAAVTGRPIGELREPKGKLSDAARTVAIMLAVELRAGSSAELAVRYGLSDLRSVRRIARRGRVRAAESAAFARLREQVLASLDEAPVVVPAALGTGNFERDRGSRCPGHGELRAG